MSIALNGSTQYATIADALVSGTTYTLSAWVYPTSNAGTVFARRSTSVANAVAWTLVITGGGNVNAVVRDDAGHVASVTSSGTVTLNAWNHVAIKRAGDTVTVYLGGSAQGSATAASAIGTITANTTSVGATVAGVSSFGGFLAGRVSRVSAWNTGLSDAEVLSIANGTTWEYSVQAGSHVYLNYFAGFEPTNASTPDMPMVGSVGAVWVGSPTQNSNPTDPGTPTVTSITDSHVFQSPACWRALSGPKLESNTPGSYIKVNFTGHIIRLAVDVTPLTGAGASAADYPTIIYSVDKTSYIRRQLTSSDTTFTLFSGLPPAASHTLELYFAAVGGASLERYSTPVAVLRVGDLTTANDGALATPTDLYPKRSIAWSDSYGEGYEILALGGTAANQDATQAWPHLLARSLGSEIGTRCIAGLGWVTAAGTYPALTTSYNKYSSGNTLTIDPDTDYLICGLGSNDDNSGASDASVTAAVTTMIGNWRAAAPDATILICLSPRLAKESAVRAGVVAAGDANTVVLDVDENLLDGARWRVNGPGHPSVRGQAIYGAMLAQRAGALASPTPAEIAAAVWSGGDGSGNRSLTG